MNITIVGGGNIGTQFATHCAEKGHKVTIFTTKFLLFDRTLKIIDSLNNVIHFGEIQLATDDAKLAFSNADMVFITTPAFMANSMADIIYPYIKNNACIVLVPGIGGMECAFHNFLSKGCSIYGLQRVPSVARLVEYGKVVCAEGYRDTLFLGALPSAAAPACCKIIEGIFDMPCKPLPNFLNLTLTPSNPILHTSRLYSLFKDYSKGVVYDKVPLFYEEWDIQTSEILLPCDQEVQDICSTLSDFDLSFVKSLKIHYESQNAQQLTNKITSIKSFQGLLTPMKKIENGFIPDFSSRYFISDFSYGLSIIHQIAKFANVKTPNIDILLSWYYNLVGEQNHFDYKDYQITGLRNFKAFYKK